MLDEPSWQLVLLPVKAHLKVCRYALQLATPLAPERPIAAVNVKLVYQGSGQQIDLYSGESKVLTAVGARYSRRPVVVDEGLEALATEGVLAAGRHDRVRKDVHTDGTCQMLGDATPFNEQAFG